VHHRSQPKFNMADRNGDPSFRVLDITTIENDYAITHDYYDHRDAEHDLNIIFPIARLKQMQASGYLGEPARLHYSFMGHILGPYLDTLMGETAPRVAARLKKDQVDAVLLTPA